MLLHDCPRRIIVGALLILLLPGCSQPAPVSPTPDLAGTLVAATLTAQALLPTASPIPTEAPPAPEASATPTAEATYTPTPTVTEQPTPEPPRVNVVGKICFPGGAIPELTVYFEEADGKPGAVIQMPIAAGQSSYEVILPAGTYIAYAWLADYSRGGLYSRAVPCGLKSGCVDHAPQTFEVTVNQVTVDIDLCDWYAGPFNVPYPPGKELTELTGALTGNILYPDEDVDGLRVVAFNASTNYYYWVNVIGGKTTYVINDLPAGSYTVVAYGDDGLVGGHTSGEHVLSVVAVKAGETTSGVNITDWQLPERAYPPDPTR